MVCQHLQLGVSQAIQTLYTQNGTHHFPAKPIPPFDVSVSLPNWKVIFFLYFTMHLINHYVQLTFSLKYSLHLFFLLYPYYALYFISYCYLWDPSIMKYDLVIFMVKTMQNLPITYWIKLNLPNMVFKALPDLILPTFPALPWKYS